MYLQTLLTTFLYSGDINGALQALTDGADINVKDSMGQYPVVAALNSDRPEMLRFAIGHGARTDIIIDENGYTLLHGAIEAAIDTMVQADLVAPRPSDMEMVKILVDSGADRKARDNNGRVPLDVFNAYAANIKSFNFLKDLFRPMIPSIDEEIIFKQ